MAGAAASAISIWLPSLGKSMRSVSESISASLDASADLFSKECAVAPETARFAPAREGKTRSRNSTLPTKAKGPVATQGSAKGTDICRAIRFR